MNQLMKGECQVSLEESRKMNRRIRRQQLICRVLLGKHMQWMYWYFLREDAPYEIASPKRKWLWNRTFWLGEAFWSHMCGSDDLAIEYLIRTLKPSYRSKKWNL